MSFMSFLKTVGNDFKKGLPVVLKMAQVADVGISVANPALGGLINTSIGTVLSIEQKFTAMGQQSGTGPQKLDEAVNILYPAVSQVFAQYGVKIENSHVVNYVNAIVAALNAFPALPTPASQPSVSATPVQSAAQPQSVAVVAPDLKASTPVSDAVANAVG